MIISTLVSIAYAKAKYFSRLPPLEVTALYVIASISFQRSVGFLERPFGRDSFRNTRSEQPAPRAMHDPFTKILLRSFGLEMRTIFCQTLGLFGNLYDEMTTTRDNGLITTTIEA